MELGIKIRNLRKQKRLSQEKLANKLNINRNCLSRIETGKSEITASLLKEVAIIFDINLNCLLDVYASRNRNEKIKYVDEMCQELCEDDLDFVIKLVSNLKK